MKDQWTGKAYALSSVQSYQVHSEWEWNWEPQTRFLIVENENSRNHEGLQQTLELLQEEMIDLKMNNQGGMPILQGNLLAAEKGDIVLELVAAEDDDNLEAYRIEAGGYVHIQSPSIRGLLYGIRTLMVKTRQNKSILYGIIVDFPVMKERALHIDIGRKYYSCKWIKEKIREMSYLRLNTLQLHFSENEGFTFVSERHPEAMSEKHLSMKEILEIKEEARRYHITIIPSLDSPGHLAHALRTHPEWILKDREGHAAKGALDITNPDARAFVTDLLDEYAELFHDSPYFHIGGDEFIDFETFGTYPQLAQFARDELGIPDGEGIDAYIAYINEIADRLEKKGFVVRAWNDGLYRLNQVQKVKLKSSIQITYWTKWHANMAPVQTLLDHGHEVINYNDGFFYYVLGENAGYKYPVAEHIYDLWHPGLFSRIDVPKQEYLRPYPRQLAGCSFAIWSDTPSAQTEDEVSEGIRDPLLAMAELSWLGKKRHESFSDVKRDSV